MNTVLIEPDVATAGFSDLLSEQAELFYHLLGGAPRRAWRTRQELRAADVGLRRISMLYPEEEIFLQISVRLTAIARQRPELFRTLTTAVKAETLIRQATTGPMVAGGSDPLAPLLQKSALRNWLKNSTAERGAHLLALSEATKLELVCWCLAWAFEHAADFAHDEQRELIGGIDAFADRINTEPALQTATYLQAPAQLHGSEPKTTAEELRFAVCTRQERLADLWVQSFSN